MADTPHDDPQHTPPHAHARIVGFAIPVNEIAALAVSQGLAYAINTLEEITETVERSYRVGRVHHDIAEIYNIEGLADLVERLLEAKIHFFSGVLQHIPTADKSEDILPDVLELNKSRNYVLEEAQRNLADFRSFRQTPATQQEPPQGQGS